MPTDILFDTTGDIDFTGEDISYGESTNQHQHDILVSHSGDYKASPDVGAGLTDYLKGDDDDINEMMRVARLQLSKDGMNVQLLAWDEVTETLTINAPYK